MKLTLRYLDTLISPVDVKVTELEGNSRDFGPPTAPIGRNPAPPHSGVPSPTAFVYCNNTSRSSRCPRHVPTTRTRENNMRNTI